LSTETLSSHLAALHSGRLFSLLDREITLPKLSWMLALAFAIAAVTLTLSPAFVTGALIACALWALVGPRQAIQAMTLSVFIGYANPALVTFGTASGALMRLVLLAAAIRVLPLVRIKDVSVLWPVWAFSLLAALLSAHASPAPAISLMKIVTFAVAVTTVIVAFSRVRSSALPGLERWFWTLAVVMVALSALTLLYPHAAFFRNGRGLQGVLNHPQALGTVLAPLVAWLLAGVLLNRSRIKPIYMVSVSGFCAVMFLTQARTAAVASALAVVVAAIKWVLTNRKPGHAGWGRVALVMVLGCVAVVGVDVATGKVSTAIEKFVFKRGEHDVGDAFLASRGGGMIAQWQHFLDKPVTGNGFGVYADGKFPSGVVEFMGIPISAPVEKGFVPTAVLEETGLFGGLLFVTMLFVLGRIIWRTQDYRGLAMFAACLAVNLGEAVILAPGGVGLLIWLFIGRALGMSRPPAKKREVKAVVQDPVQSDEPARVAAQPRNNGLGTGPAQVAS
jgi:hypothetical protein